jgi:hypothetical protein
LISETLILFIFIALWIITFVLMWAIKNDFIPGIGGIIGVMLGVRLMTTVDNILGLIVIFIGFYQLYVAAFAEGKKK